MPIVFKNKMGMLAVNLDDTLVKPFIKSGTNRVIATINNTNAIHCALRKNKEGEFYITIGAKMCKELNIKNGSLIDITLKKDTSELQFEIPIEFEEVLKQDADAKKILDNLTDGNKRSIIYLITLVKSSEKRIEKSLHIAEKLKQGITNAKLMYKT